MAGIFKMATENAKNHSREFTSYQIHSTDVNLLFFSIKVGLNTDNEILNIVKHIYNHNDPIFLWSKDYIYIVVKCQPSCFTDSGREIPNFAVEVCSAN